MIFDHEHQHHPEQVPNPFTAYKAAAWASLLALALVLVQSTTRVLW